MRELNPPAKMQISTGRLDFCAGLAGFFRETVTA
jgi:hypothetical protein